MREEKKGITAYRAFIRRTRKERPNILIGHYTKECTALILTVSQLTPTSCLYFFMCENALQR